MSNELIKPESIDIKIDYVLHRSNDDVFYEKQPLKALYKVNIEVDLTGMELTLKQASNIHKIIREAIINKYRQTS